MNMISKIISTGVLGAVLAVSLGIPTTQAKNYSDRDFRFGRNHRDRDYRHFDRNDRFFKDRNIFDRDFSHRRRFFKDNDFYKHFRNRRVSFISNPYYFRKNFSYFPSSYYSSYPGHFYPRNIYVINRDDLSNIIYLNNGYGGQYSTDYARLYVDNDFYRRLAYDFELDANIDIRINTGDNTLSYNTVGGGLVTGGVDVNVNTGY